MSPSERYQIEVTASAEFVAGQSRPEDDHYVFAYHITVRNTGTVAAQLIARHWVITDGNNKVQEVHGQGVVGEQPVIEAGDSYSYAAGCPLGASSGSMVGAYYMTDVDGRMFDVAIPAFSLDVPDARRTLN